PQKRKEALVGRVGSFIEYDARVGATDANFFHPSAIQAYRGSLIFLTVVLNRHWRFSRGFALLDNRGLVLQFQLVVAWLELRPINHDGLIERNVVAVRSACHGQRDRR